MLMPNLSRVEKDSFFLRFLWLAVSFTPTLSSEGIKLLLGNVLAVSFTPTLSSEAGYVRTVAGGGFPHKGAKTDCHDRITAADGFGSDARFNYPWGITYHSEDNTIYVGDCSCPGIKSTNANERIRKINVDTGEVTSLAGGLKGFRDGRGKTAQFRHISGMVIDSSTGTMYAVDSGNDRIRKVNLKTGDVLTYAGDGQSGFVDGHVTKARFQNPQAVTIDKKNKIIYLSDTDNHAIRVISLNDGMVRTLTGGQRGHQDGHSKQAKFYNPTGIAYNEKSQVLYIADHYNHVIRIVDINNGKVSTLAGGKREGFLDGTGASARFNYPEGLAYDPEYEKVYVVEFDNNAVRMITLDGKVTTLAGGHSEGYDDGYGTKGHFFHPTGLAFDSQRKIIYVTDQYNHMVRSITAVGYKGKLPSFAYAVGSSYFNAVVFVSCVCLLGVLVLTRRRWRAWFTSRNKTY